MSVRSIWRVSWTSHTLLSFADVVYFTIHYTVHTILKLDSVQYTIPTVHTKGAHPPIILKGSWGTHREDHYKEASTKQQVFFLNNVRNRGFSVLCSFSSAERRVPGKEPSSVLYTVQSTVGSTVYCALYAVLDTLVDCILCAVHCSEHSSGLYTVRFTL